MFSIWANPKKQEFDKKLLTDGWNFSLLNQSHAGCRLAGWHMPGFLKLLLSRKSVYVTGSAKTLHIRVFYMPLQKQL